MASEKGHHEVVEVLCSSNANLHAIDEVHEYKYNGEYIIFLYIIIYFELSNNS